jgi:hypothetical protein
MKTGGDMTDAAGGNVWAWLLGLVELVLVGLFSFALRRSVEHGEALKGQEEKVANLESWRSDYCGRQEAWNQRIEDKLDRLIERQIPR